MIRREGKIPHGSPSRPGVYSVDMSSDQRNMLLNILPFALSHTSYAADAAEESSSGQHMSFT